VILFLQGATEGQAQLEIARIVCYVLTDSIGLEQLAVRIQPSTCMMHPWTLPMIHFPSYHI
jgi:hypothetical protein